MATFMDLFKMFWGKSGEGEQVAQSLKRGFKSGPILQRVIVSSSTCSQSCTKCKFSSKIQSPL